MHLVRSRLNFKGAYDYLNNKLTIQEKEAVETSPTTTDEPATTTVAAAVETSPTTTDEPATTTAAAVETSPTTTDEPKKKVQKRKRNREAGRQVEVDLLTSTRQRRQRQSNRKYI